MTLLRALLSVCGLLGGMAGQIQQASLQPPWHYATALGAASVAAIALVVGARTRASVPCAHPVREVMRVALLVAAAACAGWGWAGVRAHGRLAEQLPPALEGVDVQVVGTVDALPVRRPDGVRFTFEVESARHAGAPVLVPARILLGWYHGDAQAGPGSVAGVVPGERWAFTVRLRQPHGTLNPHGFDYELWLFERGLRATGHVREGAAGDAPRRLGVASGHAIERARHAMREAILVRLGDTPEAGLLTALSVGDQAAIGRAEWDVFRTTGVAHLAAISGLHVTMFAWLAARLAGSAWRRSHRLMLRVPAGTAGHWAGIGAACAYALFAGWGVPAQRTVYMLACAGLARAVGVRWPWPWVVGGAAAAVCVLDPWALLQPGFWLSFVAVMVLMADGAEGQGSAGPAPHPMGLLARARALGAAAVRTQVLAMLALAPLTLLFFQQTSIVGFLANLVAIPMVTLLITPLALLGAVAPPLWSLGAVLAQWGIAALSALTAWPWAQWQAAAAPGWAVGLGLLGAAVLATPAPWLLRSLGAVLLLPLFSPAPVGPEPGQFELLVVDVGQGTAVIVRTERHALLYDAGPQHSRDSDAGAQVLVPLLRALGVQQLDLLMLSHRDSDHVGGAAAVLRSVPTVRASSSLEPGHPLRRAAPHQPCVHGQRWQWDGVVFEVLHPAAADLPGGAVGPKPNARSCVLRVAATQRTVLLTGDIESGQEAGLATLPEGVKADVLLVPHHGSRTSSSPAFIDAVQPRWAVVQAGYRNRFGHPAADVVGRYVERGIKVVRTDQCGAWQWRSADGSARCERAARPRYWRAVPPQGQDEAFGPDVRSAH